MCVHVFQCGCVCCLSGRFRLCVCSFVCVRVLCMGKLVPEGVVWVSLGICGWPSVGICGHLCRRVWWGYDFAHQGRLGATGLRENKLGLSASLAVRLTGSHGFARQQVGVDRQLGCQADWEPQACKKTSWG